MLGNVVVVWFMPITKVYIDCEKNDCLGLEYQETSTTGQETSTTGHETGKTITRSILAKLAVYLYNVSPK